MFEMITYYAVIPFMKMEHGIRKGEAFHVPSQRKAESYQYLLNDSFVGALVFSRSGYPGSGYWHEAEIIGLFGTIPEWAIDSMD